MTTLTKEQAAAWLALEGYMGYIGAIAPGIFHTTTHSELWKDNLGQIHYSTEALAASGIIAYLNSKACPLLEIPESSLVSIAKYLMEKSHE